jgi:copper chaperone CopZ
MAKQKAKVKLKIKGDVNQVKKALKKLAGQEPDEKILRDVDFRMRKI